MAPVPQTPAQSSEPPAPRRDTPAPAPSAPARYQGPPSGLVLWSGQLPKNDPVSVDGATTSVGLILSGSLPGVPVTVTIEPKDVTLVDPPSAANGWKHFSFHAKKGRKTVVTFHWTVQ